MKSSNNSFINLEILSLLSWINFYLFLSFHTNKVRKYHQGTSYLLVGYLFPLQQRKGNPMKVQH